MIASFSVLGLDRSRFLMGERRGKRRQGIRVKMVSPRIAESSLRKGETTHQLNQLAELASSLTILLRRRSNWRIHRRGKVRGGSLRREPKRCGKDSLEGWVDGRLGECRFRGIGQGEETGRRERR